MRFFVCGGGGGGIVSTTPPPCLPFSLPLPPPPPPPSHYPHPISFFPHPPVFKWHLLVFPFFFSVPSHLCSCFRFCPFCSSSVTFSMLFFFMSQFIRSFVVCVFFLFCPCVAVRLPLPSFCQLHLFLLCCSSSFAIVCLLWTCSWSAVLPAVDLCCDAFALLLLVR